MSVFDFLEPSPGEVFVDEPTQPMRRGPGPRVAQNPMPPSRPSHAHPPLNSFLESPGAGHESREQYGARGSVVSGGGSQAGSTARGGRRARGKRDFQKENIMMIREKERLNRLNKAREEEEKARAKAFKLKRFERVESKVKAMRSQRGGGGRNRPNNETNGGERQFLRAGQGAARAAERAAEAAVLREQVDMETAEEMEAAEAAAAAAAAQSSQARAKVRQRRKAPLPKARGELAPREKKDYLASNARAARAAKSKSARKAKDDPRQRADFGKVPDYLIKRKIEAAKRELEEAANAPDPDCPPGMVQMPDAERLETLELLQANRNDTLVQLNTMPLRCDTFGLKRKKHLLEIKLEETDEAIKIFSRDKVYINIDDA